MKSEINQKVMHQVIRAIDQGDWAMLEAHPGLYETRESVPALRAAFPDMQSTIEQEIVAEQLEGARLPLLDVLGKEGRIPVVPEAQLRIHVRAPALDSVQRIRLRLHSAPRERLVLTYNIVIQSCPMVKRAFMRD